MQPIMQSAATSDDEEDLESLRLAALQSLKKQPVVNNADVLVPQPPKPFQGPKLSNKRGRYHGGGRNNRNGMYNNRIRNSNLISVPTIQSEEELTVKLCEKPAPKLILPQDRYCANTKEKEEKTEASSKFDRFNDSESDSDSESEDEKASKESPKKLGRADSLEALMQELENEIKGDAPKPKRVKKSQKKSESVNEAAEVKAIEEIKTEDPVAKSEDEKPINKEDKLGEKETQSRCEEEKKKSPKWEEEKKRSPRREEERPVRREDDKERLPRSDFKEEERPLRKSKPYKKNRHQRPMQNFPPAHAYPPVMPPVVPFPPYTYDMQMPPTVPFDPYYPPAPAMINLNSPPMFSPQYERPLSPISIKTNILSTISAPLSPRSAAFVLQNRQIIERRKKSPRRSFSRSPTRSISPRYRRSKSKSPRSPAPAKRHSPTRRTPPLRRTSPVRRLSPNRHSPPNQTSPRRSPTKYRSPKRSPKRSHVSPQRNTARQRPRTKDDKDKELRKRTRSLSPSPERKQSPLKEKERLDPVLEARKRKFENNGVVPTEGIIRLRPKNAEEAAGAENSNSKSPESKDEELLNEDELPADDVYIELNTKVDDLFSDEESDSENEGRFKSSQSHTSRDVAVLPFTQLVNGIIKPVETRKRPESDRDRRPRTSRSKPNSQNDRRKEDRDRDRLKPRSERSRSPLKNQNQEPVKTEPARAKESLKKEVRSSPRKRPIVSPIESKKIEIKIRNPSKYEVESNKNQGEKREEKKSVRKVEVANDCRIEEGELVEAESEIIIDNEENDSEDIVNKNEDAGDLRAQLSRKRAERQNKIPKEGVPTRLLQNALQGAVFKKSKSKKKDKEAAPVDVDANLNAARGNSARIGCDVSDTDSNSAGTDRKVRVLHCEAESQATASDGKLPIHLRLGIPGSLDMFTDKPHKISRKRSKNKGNFDQV